MFIGAHVSTSGGLDRAIERGRLIGAESLQIFPSAPVQWSIKGFPEDDMAVFKTEWPKHFKEIVFHGIYLVNLAGENPENLQKSIKALKDTLNLAPKLGIKKTIFHTGTYKNGEIVAKDQISQAINTILDETPQESMLIFENTAGSTIGAKLEDLAWLIEVAKDKDRVGVCLDTCHAFASGYDVASEEGYAKFINDVDGLLGLNMVKAWHLNDSKFDLGQKRDRHENIGQGYISSEGFRYLINDDSWNDVSGYLEVPGFNDEGPDKRNVELLKSLRNR